MLQGIIMKKILDIIMKRLLKDFKLVKLLKYVEEPNELDGKMEEVLGEIEKIKILQKSGAKSVNKALSYIEEMEKEIAMIKAIAHKPIDGLTDRLNKLEKKLKIFK